MSSIGRFLKRNAINFSPFAGELVILSGEIPVKGQSPHSSNTVGQIE